MAFAILEGRNRSLISSPLSGQLLFSDIQLEIMYPFSLKIKTSSG